MFLSMINNMELDNEWLIYTVGHVLPLKKLCLKAIVCHTTHKPLQIQYAKINELKIPLCLKREYNLLYIQNCGYIHPRFTSKIL